MKQTILILALYSLIPITTLQARPNQGSQPVPAEAQKLADKLADEVAAVLINALGATPITKEQAKLGKELAGLAKTGIAMERQGASGVNKLKLAGLNIKGYVIYQKLLAMMQLRAELSKALLNELQKPGVSENIASRVHELVRFVLEGIESNEDRIQELCDLLSQEKLKALCVGVLSNIYERSVQKSGNNKLIAPAYKARIEQFARQVNLVSMKCFLGRQISNIKEASTAEQEILKAQLALVFRIEERIANAVEQALSAKS